MINNNNETVQMTQCKQLSLIHILLFGDYNQTKYYSINQNTSCTIKGYHNVKV